MADGRAGSAPAADALIEGRDYYCDPQGRFVFTEQYNRERGYCCFQGCRHCPWGQAGKSPAEAQAALRALLATLQEQVRQAGLPVNVLGYRNGVLAARNTGGKKHGRTGYRSCCQADSTACATGAARCSDSVGIAGS